MTPRPVSDGRSPLSARKREARTSSGGSRKTTYARPSRRAQAMRSAAPGAVGVPPPRARMHGVAASTSSSASDSAVRNAFSPTRRKASPAVVAPRRAAVRSSRSVHGAPKAAANARPSVDLPLPRSPMRTRCLRGRLFTRQRYRRRACAETRGDDGQKGQHRDLRGAVNRRDCTF